VAKSFGSPTGDDWGYAIDYDTSSSRVIVGGSFGANLHLDLSGILF